MRTAVPIVIAGMPWAAWLSRAFVQEADSALPETLVTSQALESKIAEMQAATDMTEKAKTRLVALYRKALSNLQAARDNEASAATFRRTAEIQAIRAALAPDAQAEPLKGLDADSDTPLPVLEQLLQKEQADLTAADERRADFKSRLAILEQRPEAISQRLAEATQQREEAPAALRAPAADDASPVFAQA